MPGDPKECRQHALAYVRLVKPQHHHNKRRVRQFGADLDQLADDLERTVAFLDVLEDETEPERRTG